ncbi:MAG: isoprenyl transferase [Dysgonamonadaceae bacterium]|jgi:undecaprenyl diphosphate synthase|nr:isoprenyl transferase [Dysgonamonadaceae bacterium]MDD3309330.1 isoprenyl transferase [Dysgonamonadaceae bacterium]MDD3901123.1 isoprenyl transferase [Dysgonamonadaceae bacterium]MDD4399414.1 isoprenyl transferase [Dysgonamonadaceae bacterium]MEA5082143.1 isoprenyl transferase [Dysgonamonadaceae bacterium]
MSLINNINTSSLPKHVAIIMDGNGRWAKANGLQRSEGHQEGVAALRRAVEAASNIGIKYLTVYVFSTENWERPKEEVESLMDLMVYALKKETPSLVKNNVRLMNIGDLNRLPLKTRESLLASIEDTSQCTGLNLVVALSYSSKWEIGNALKLIAKDVTEGHLQLNEINENLVSDYLTTKGIPDPELMIRTGGEQRISNFLLWQSAYTEFYFTETFWPDFSEDSFYEAILEFQNRERRFGKISEQIESFD